MIPKNAIIERTNASANMSDLRAISKIFFRVPQLLQKAEDGGKEKV